MEWVSNTLPTLKKDEILVRTIAGAISIGAELPQYMGNDCSEINPTYPKETGYESYGEVIAIGECVRSVRIGDRVVAFYGHKNYGIVKESKLIPVSRDIHFSYALLAILSCDAAKGVLKLSPKSSNKVLVSGMGTMGLLFKRIYECWAG